MSISDFNQSAQPRCWDRKMLPAAARDLQPRVLLHYLIVLSAVAIYFAASRRLHFLIEYPLMCGLFFGVAIDIVMRFIVLPLSAMHARGLINTTI